MTTDTGEVALAQRVLASLLSEGGLPAQAGADVRFSGAGDLYPTPFRLGASTAAVLAAARQAADRLDGRHAPFAVDLALSALTTGGFQHVRLDGRSVKGPRDALTGFYRSADARWIFLHLNYPHHRRGAFAVLGVAEDAAQPAVAEAVRAWEAQRLETALNGAGVCAAVARSEAEWQATEAYAAVARHPLIRIERIDGVADGAPVARPLAACRMVDFTRVLAGPTCARFLAARSVAVTRVDHPRVPDLLAYQLDANRDKALAVLDLDDAQDRRTLDELIDQADIFLQAYRPGVASRHGLSPVEVAARRPGIVYASLSAYGEDGPWGQRRGFDSVLQAATGLAWQHGGERPALLPTSPVDYLSGFLLAYGVLIALHRRAQDGGSYLVRTSLARVASWLVELEPLDHPGTAMPDPALIDGCLQETTTPQGVIRHLRWPYVEA